MKHFWKSTLAGIVILSLSAASALAQAPGPVEGSFVVKDFKLSNGQSLPELKLGYVTLGEPTGEPVLVLHGTGGTGKGMLNPGFGGELFGPGQPLDAAKHFIILPDAIGTGRSSKPSDGLRMAFPRYGYEDMVRGQHLVVQHLGVKKLKLVIGNSMGGMQTWMWGYMYPDMMANLVPMAATPNEVAGRNWMTRRMLIDMIKLDADWNGGAYTKQPRSLAMAQAYFQMGTSGGDQGLHQVAPTNAKADEWVEKQLATPTTADANDIIYQFDASRDYNPAPHLEKITARLLAVNSADDERNPPHLGLMQPAMSRMKSGALYLIPASPDTRGHGTTGMAKWWKAELKKFMDAGN